MAKDNTKTRDSRRLATVSLLLGLLALASVATITAAWLSIADHAKVYSFNLDITTGVTLKFDFDKHETFDEYVSTLGMEQIFARVNQERGVNPATHPLEPVTTTNAQNFYFQNGAETFPESGAYVEFTLYFIANRDMLVHLSSDNSKYGNDGTLVSSSMASLPSAMRLSFTCDDKTKIYDPGISESYVIGDTNIVFGLPSQGEMVYNEENTLFSLVAHEPKPVTFRIWFEGTDPACVDSIKTGEFSVRLRFIGTDENNEQVF